ncbi:MAG: 50S ribosomal protein L20 [Candidatus Marinimicrobia bacterium]|nr:50S ribosomal protein L20 [Candidatus Neomarinimicrobiota bacterium]
MPKSSSSVARKRRHKKYLKAARGYYGARSRLYKTARETVERAWVYAYRDRKDRKRQFRRLWIARINAAARLNGVSYSRLMNGLKKSSIELNRKMLAEIAVTDPAGFAAIVAKTK